jgi:hypothetical protein
MAKDLEEQIENKSFKWHTDEVNGQQKECNLLCNKDRESAGRSLI